MNNTLNASLIDYTSDELKALFEEKGFRPFNAIQVYDWFYKKENYNIDSWSNVSIAVKEFIKDNLDISIPKVVWNGLSQDGTRKFLLGLSDGQTIESVLIPAKNNRLTLCVSTQVGCAIGCTFCHTATQGLKRHLKISEIVGQVLAVHDWCHRNVDPNIKITNLVYMGMGEPLHNFENVKKATLVFLDQKGLCFGQRKITLSTSGLVPQIEKLGEFPPINIAISLHAAHDNIRSELMPINKRYDLTRLFEAIKKIPLKAHRRITYEYLLIDNLNMAQEDIDGLVRLLDRRESKINLIPFNDYPGSKFKRPSDERILWFQKELIDKGYTTTIRTTMGKDILAACGQLKSQFEEGRLRTAATLGT